ncbi:hypothetical protein [Roseivirga sp.]|uniref:hypothetical protein n=1 Tax=Roseivirga sp. TaxID=1964215 RepID=UPI003B51A854
MKKFIIILSTILLGGQLTAQKVTPDQLDQIKRMSRRNNHIEKTYTGTVEKLLYSFQTLGGPLSGLVFRKSDGKLTYIRFSDWYGKSFKPFLQEGKKAEIRVTGDPLLLDVLIYRDDYLRELEFSMKEEIFGMGILKAVKNETGSISLETMDKRLIQNRFFDRLVNVYNADVKSKSELNESEILICLQNGDSLLMAKGSDYSLDEIPQKLSYVKEVRDEDNPAYFRNPHVFNLYRGKASQVLISQNGSFLINTLLMNTEVVSIDEFIPENNGIVESAWVRNLEGERLLVKFDFKRGQEIKSLFELGTRTVHLMAQRDSWKILGIEEGETVNEISRGTWRHSSEDYNKNISTIEGKITTLFQTKIQGIERYTGAIIDDSIYMNIPDYTGISIGRNIKVGDQIEIEGYKKVNSDNEYHMKEYDIYYPKTIVLGKKTYSVKDLFRNGL